MTQELDGAVGMTMPPEYKASDARVARSALAESLEYAAQTLEWGAAQAGQRPGNPLIALLRGAAVAIQTMDEQRSDLRADQAYWRRRTTEALGANERLGGECRTLESQKAALATENSDLKRQLAQSKSRHPNRRT